MQVAENLHRAELTVQERADQIAEWVRLTAEKGAQLAPPGGRQPHDRGIKAAVRELGIDRTEAQRAVKIAGITPEARAAADDAGLDGNQVERHTSLGCRHRGGGRLTDGNKTGPRLVAENDEREIRRHRAQEVVDEALSKLAANMLRVIRGAGEPISLGLQCLGVVEAYRAYHEAVGHLPPAFEVQAGLRLPRPDYHEDTIGQDSALKQIMSGSLQVIASKMLGQQLQEAAGDREIRDGMRHYEEWREERRRHYAAAAAAAEPGGSVKRKPYGARRVVAKRKMKSAPKSLA